MENNETHNLFLFQFILAVKLTVPALALINSFIEFILR